MASIINSTTTSPGGLISTGDSSNSLLIQTGDTTAITINESQVVSLTNPLPAASGGTGSNTGLTSLNASSLTSGTVPDARFPATLPATSGANLTSLNASSVSSGTLSNDRLGIVSVAKGGTGTATPSLVGGTNITISGSWPNQTVTAAGGAPTTAQVLSATAGLTAGDVGSYCWAGVTNSSSYSFGATLAGSSLRPAGMQATNQNNFAGFTYANPRITSQSGTSLSGTWRLLGRILGDVDCSTNAGASLWVRVS